MKKVWICLDVDVRDLEYSYTIERGSDPCEFWGQKTDEPWVHVDIEYVKYKGEFVDDFDHSAIEEYILDNEEQQ